MTRTRDNHTRTDSKRTKEAKQTARDMRAARALKASQYNKR